MDTLLSFRIALAVTFFFLRRYLKTLATPKRQTPARPRLHARIGSRP